MSDGDKKIIDGVEYTKSSGCWYFLNKQELLHSPNDKPAVIWLNGSKEWYKYGQRHRDNDKPAIIFPSGKKQWWVNGELQPSKHFTCFYIKDDKRYKQFFETECEAKQCESYMLSQNICAWVTENG